MKRFYSFLSVLLVSFIICTYMYSFNNFRNIYYTLSIDKESSSDDDDWEELVLDNRTGSGSPSVIASRTVSLFKPVRAFINAYSIKINILLEEKVNIKIIDETGSPVYLRQFTPGTTDEIVINTSGWDSGNYSIIFTSTTGTIIANGDFSIH